MLSPGERGTPLGEGCFHISITINKTCKIGWQVKACFAISLGTKDLALLKRIQSYFCGIGEINKCGKNAYQYRVTSLKELVNVIIPHFINYPLITQKRAAAASCRGLLRDRFSSIQTSCGFN
jgi:hypothetical protein